MELTEGLVVHPDRMRRNLDLTGGQLVTERLAAALAPRLGRAAAQELLTRASIDTDSTGRPLREVLAEVLAEIPGPAGGREHGLDLAALLDPVGYTGAAGPLVDRALEQRPPQRRQRGAGAAG